MESEGVKTGTLTPSYRINCPLPLSSSIRHNPAIKAHYMHLKAQGKESKVAIVACMRKLLSILNTLVATDQLWEDRTLTKT